MSSSRTTRIGIIGAGVIARHHATAAAKLPGKVELRVTDPNPKAVEAFRAQFPGATVFPDLNAMLADEAREGEIAIVATPPAFHCDAALAALRRGRHVLCEKPMALNSQEATRMFTAAREHHRHLGCCSVRFGGLPATRHTKRLVDDGTLGKVYRLNFIDRSNRARSGVEYQPGSRWFLDPAINGGGVMMDWGPYDIACLCEVLEPVRVEVVSAWMATPRTGIDPFDPMRTEQHVSAGMLFHCTGRDPVPVTYERAACTHGEAHSVVEVEGTLGAVRWQWCNNKGTVIHGFDREGKLETETLQLPETTGLGVHDRPLVFFHQYINGQASPAIVNEHALFNFKLLRAIYDAASQQRPQVVAL